MSRALSPILGERCGKRSSRSYSPNHPHPLTSFITRSRQSNSTHLGGLKQCRDISLDLRLTRCKERVLQCFQHPVRYGCARLTGEAQLTKQPTDIESRGDDPRIFDLGGLFNSYNCWNNPTNNRASPGIDFCSASSFQPVLGSVLRNAQRRGQERAFSFIWPKRIAGKP